MEVKSSRLVWTVHYTEGFRISTSIRPIVRLPRRISRRSDRRSDRISRISYEIRSFLCIGYDAAFNLNHRIFAD
jgi:hypothetical protein